MTPISESIWVSHRLPIAYATIGIVALIVAAILVRRVRQAIAKERRAREREESLR